MDSRDYTISVLRKALLGMLEAPHGNGTKSMELRDSLRRKAHEVYLNTASPEVKKAVIEHCTTQYGATPETYEEAVTSYGRMTLLEVERRMGVL